MVKIFQKQFTFKFIGDNPTFQSFHIWFGSNINLEENSNFCILSDKNNRITKNNLMNNYLKQFNRK
jgi:hypothetical protein